MVKEQTNRFIDSLKYAILLVAIIWGVHLLLLFLGFNNGNYGVFPRRIFGLTGILTSPWVHGSFQHLINNSAPLLVLTTMILYFYRRIAWPSIGIIYLLSGILLWIFGRSVFHIGASGVIYGMAAFVLWNGIFRRNIRAIALSVIVVFLYGGMFYGVLPIREGVSWEGHLLGAIAGVFTSYIFRSYTEIEEIREKPSWEIEGERSQYLLDRDTFDLTREERSRMQREQGDFWTKDHT